MSLQDHLNSKNRPNKPEISISSSYPTLGNHPDVVQQIIEAQKAIAPHATLSDFSEWKGWGELGEVYRTSLLGALFGQFFERGTGERAPSFFTATSIVEEEAIYAGILRYILDTGLLHPTACEHECKEYRKAGPYVRANAQDLLPRTVGYFNKPVDVLGQHADYPKMQELALRLGEMIVESNGGHLAPLGANEAFDRMVKTTYFGAPFFTSNWFDFKEATLEANVLYDWMVDVLDNHNWDRVVPALSLPPVTFSRVVPSGRLRGDVRGTNKSRRTFATTKFEGALAKAFSYPFLQIIRNLVPWSFYGGNHVGAPFMKHAVRKSGSILNLDWSSFDETARRAARDLVRIVLRTVFDPEFGPLVDMIMDSMEVDGFLTPYGYIHNFKNEIGLVSGAGFTGIVASLYNYILNTVMWADFGVEPVALFTYGDDTTVCFREEKLPVPLMEVERKANEYGMIINGAKQDYGEGSNRFALFLQKRYFVEGTNQRVTDGIHSMLRQLPRLLWKDTTSEPTEDSVFGRAEVESPARRITLDALSNLEELRYHPYFEELVWFCIIGHPTHLDPRLVIDYHKVRVRELSGEEAPIRGIETLRVVKVIEAAYNVALGADWQFGSHVPSSHEIRYHAERLHEHETARCKGFGYTLDQRLKFFKGESIPLTPDQRLAAQAYGKHKGSSLFDRVVTYQQNHGVLLTKQQVLSLEKGAKVTLTPSQKNTAALFGRLDDPERQEFINENGLFTTVFAVKTKSLESSGGGTLEEARDAAIAAFGVYDDTTFSKLLVYVNSRSRMMEYVAQMERAIVREGVSIARGGLPLEWLTKVRLY